MANIEIGGRLHSTATGNVVTGANEVLDDTKNKKQSVINAEVDETIGDDNTAGTIKGRIKTAEGKLDTLNGDSSTSGSVAKAVADAKTELIGGATSNGNTLKKVEDRTATLETAVGSNGSVDQRIAAAKSEVIGDAASDYNTLGKLEDKIQAEASARESAVSNEAQARQDAITAETNRATTRENQIYDLVHTPEQHYVTVATYADLANIASPSDDTIYRVSSYNGNTNQVDNTVYSEYGYNGTNFVFLCVKSQIDEVYDISVHHSNNTYVDLAAALDGGNNIPQELRRGGMSVKFVQSSDNKYVQARCMAQNFTTDVTQWQGVDNEPTAGSGNLVKSGGVNKVDRVLGTKIESIYNKYYIDYNHLVESSATMPPTYRSNSNFDSVWVAIEKGSTRLNVTGATPLRFRYFSSFEVDDFPTTQIDMNTTGVIPSGSVLAIVIFRHSDNPSGLGSLLISQDNPYSQKNETEKGDVVASKGFYIDYNHLFQIDAGLQSGSYIESETYDSILLPIDQDIQFIQINGATPTRYIFYNSPDKIWDNVVGFNTTGFVPKNARFCSISLKKSDNPNGYDNVIIYKRINDELSSRGLYIDYNHLFSGSASEGHYIEHDNFDSIHLVINPQDSAIIVDGSTPRTFWFFSSSILEFSNVIEFNSTGVVPQGAKYCSITMRHVDNPNGYDNTIIRKTVNVTSLSTKLMKIVKSGNNISIRTRLSDANDIIIEMYQAQNNMTFYRYFVGDKTLVDSQLKTNTYLVGNITDCVGAIGIDTFWFLYAQHGWTIPKMTASGHTLDDSDLGSIWKDQNEKRFKIGNIDGDDIYLIPELSKDAETDVYSASWNGSEQYPTSITHVSGATHTSSITGTSVRYDLVIQTSQGRKFVADGNEIAEDGTYYCDEFVISEHLIGHNIGKVQIWFPTPVYDGSLIDWDRSFVFKGSSVACNMIINTVYPFKIDDYRGCIPQMPLQKGDYHSYTLIPKVKKQFNSHRIDLPFNSDDGAPLANSGYVYRNSNDLYDVNDQPERCITYLKDDNDNYLVGMAGGGSLLRGISKTDRNTLNPANALTCTFGGVTVPNKFYPIMMSEGGFTDGIVPDTFIKEFCCYYCWFDPSANEGQVYWYKDGDSYILYCHCQTSQSKLAINLPNFMEGMVVESTIEKTDGATLLTTQVVSGRLYVSYDTTDNAANYIVARLK